MELFTSELHHLNQKYLRLIYLVKFYLLDHRVFNQVIVFMKIFFKLIQVMFYFNHNLDHINYDFMLLQQNCFEDEEACTLVEQGHALLMNLSNNFLNVRSIYLTLQLLQDAYNLEKASYHLIHYLCHIFLLHLLLLLKNFLNFCCKGLVLYWQNYYLIG